MPYGLVHESEEKLRAHFFAHGDPLSDSTTGHIRQSTFNRWRTWVSGTWKYDDPRLNMSHEGAALVWHLQPRVVLFPCPTNDCVSLCFVICPRWRRGRFAYKMAAFLTVFPTRCRRGSFAVTWRYALSYVHRFTVTGVTVKRWTYDNAQRHVTALRPISEAAHSWLYDKNSCLQALTNGIFTPADIALSALEK